MTRGGPFQPTPHPVTLDARRARLSYLPPAGLERGGPKHCGALTAQPNPLLMDSGGAVRSPTIWMIPAPRTASARKASRGSTAAAKGSSTVTSSSNP